MVLSKTRLCTWPPRDSPKVNKTFPERWIGRRGPIIGPKVLLANEHHVTSVFLGDQVYRKKSSNVQKLKIKIAGVIT